MRDGPWDEPEEDEDEALEEARAEMDEFLEEARNDPFVALDTDIEDNPVYHEYEADIRQTRFTAFAMLDDFDSSDGGDAPDFSDE